MASVTAEQVEKCVAATLSTFGVVHRFVDNGPAVHTTPPAGPGWKPRTVVQAPRNRSVLCEYVLHPLHANDFRGLYGTACFAGGAVVDASHVALRMAQLAHRTSVELAKCDLGDTVQPSLRFDEGCDTSKRGR